MATLAIHSSTATSKWLQLNKNDQPLAFLHHAVQTPNVGSKIMPDLAHVYLDTLVTLTKLASQNALLIQIVHQTWLVTKVNAMTHAQAHVA